MAYCGGRRFYSCSSGSFGRAPGSRRVHLGSFGSFKRAPWVVGFIRIHSGATLWSWGKFGFVCFIRAGPWGHRVPLGSFASFGRAPVVVGLIRVRLFHWGTSSGSFTPRGSFVWFIRAHFIRFRLVYSALPLLSSGSFAFLSLRRAPGVGAHPGVVVFFWHSGSLVRRVSWVFMLSLGRALGS